MLSTLHLTILSLIIGASALTTAVVGLSRSDRTAATQSAGVAAPLFELQRAAEYASSSLTPDQVGQEWLRLNHYQPHTYTPAASGLTFDYLHEFELRTKSVEGGELILVEHPSTDMAFQFFIQPTDMPLDALTTERLLDQASSIPGRVIPGYNQDVTLGFDSQIPVLKIGVSEEGIGEYREAWFVHNGHLFQFTIVSANPDVLEGWFNGMVHQNIYFPNSDMVVPGRTDLEGNPLPPRNITPGTIPTPEDFL